MALFGKKETDTKKTDPKETKKSTAKTSRTAIDSNAVLIRPRITEKASIVSEEGNVYVFEIAPKAGKRDVAQAVHDVYNVTPIAIRTAKIPAKKVFVRGKRGVKSGGKKAYVYLKEGDTIEII